MCSLIYRNIKSSNIYKNGPGELSLSYKLKNFPDPIFDPNAGKIISLQDKAKESLGGAELKAPVVRVNTTVAVARPRPSSGGASSSGGGGGGI